MNLTRSNFFLTLALFLIVTLWSWHGLAGPLFLSGDKIFIPIGKGIGMENIPT